MSKNWLLCFPLLLIFSLNSQAQTCRSLFSNEKAVTAAQIYAGQDAIGKDYALIKELTNAGMDPNLEFSDLSKKKKKKLLKSVLSGLQEPRPAVRDPLGRIFIVDGHHTLYVAALLEPQLDLIPLKIKIIKDFSYSSISMTDFQNEAQKSHWFYTSSIDKLVSYPHKITNLKNSVERSLVGLTFLAIEEQYGVPMKGKNFTPFVQFYLADLIHSQNLFQVPSKVSKKSVLEFEKNILTSPQVILFLIESLRPEAPQKLRQFLNSLGDH